MHTPERRGRPSAAFFLSLATALALAAPVSAQPEPVQAVRVENAPIEVLGGEPTLRAENALLTRYEDQLVFEIRMDTPVPGSYVYPPAVPDIRKAAPEVFTVWAFVFNNPERCVGTDDWARCGVDDFNDDIRTGVYSVAGHVTSIDHEGGAFILDRGTDGQMVMRGEIAVGDPQWPDLPPGAITHPLENPLGAEVHVAIAPHGQVDPATVATELYAPAGDPTCGCWWVAFFGLEGYEDEEG